ncbi:hypothetical protein L7F22_049351 [Adiantum nelumboides]|nr:hypothetical protein [Adiantum nelumboides]
MAKLPVESSSLTITRRSVLSCSSSFVLGLLTATLVASLSQVSGSVEADETCVAPLESLLDCLPYAQGTQPLPTPGCCTNIKKVFQTHKKCLCELIAVSFDDTKGTSGLPSFNSTLALKMPAVCDVPADPALCPGLLGISPSSPEAKEFLNSAPTANGTTLASPSHSNTTSSVTSTNLKSNSPLTMRAFSLLNVFMVIFVIFFAI